MAKDDRDVGTVPRRLVRVISLTATVVVALLGLALAYAQVSDDFRHWTAEVRFSLLTLLVLLTLITAVSGFVVWTLAIRMQSALSEAAAYRAKASNLEKVVSGLEELAFYDPLTGIPNSNYLKRLLSKQSRPAARCLVLLDLRNFGMINKRYGHWKGDQYLSQFAAMVTEATRRNEFLVKRRPLVDEKDGPSLSDGESITAFRKNSGGDEFYILINGTVVDGLGYLNRLQQRASEFERMSLDVLGKRHEFGFQAGLVAVAPTENFGTATDRVMKVLGLAIERQQFAVNWIAGEMPHVTPGSIQDKIVQTAIETFGDPHASSPPTPS